MTAAIIFSDDRTRYSKSVKRVTMSQNIIKQCIRWINERIDTDFIGRPKKTINGRGGLYHLKILDYAERCMKTNGTNYVDGIPCGVCEQIIADGEECISASRSAGKKYVHLACGQRLNYI